MGLRFSEPEVRKSRGKASRSAPALCCLSVTKGLTERGSSILFLSVGTLLKPGFKMKLAEKNALETLMVLNPKIVEIVRFRLYDNKVLPWTFVYCSRPIIVIFLLRNFPERYLVVQNVL